MLPRHHRLTRPEDFRRTIRGGLKAVTPTVVVHGQVPQSRDFGPVRVGITVNKAVGGSVVRHRVARQIRHAVAGALGSLPAGSTWVIRALPGAGGNSTTAGSSVAADVASAIASIRERLGR